MSELENNSHSIILIQFSEDVRTRTYLHYESINESLDSLCNIYEQTLKNADPSLKIATYDIGEIFDYIEKLRDLCFLIFSVDKKGYIPYGKEWIKGKLFIYLKNQIGN